MEKKVLAGIALCLLLAAVSNPLFAAKPRKAKAGTVEFSSPVPFVLFLHKNKIEWPHNMPLPKEAFLNKRYPDLKMLAYPLKPVLQKKEEMSLLEASEAEKRFSRQLAEWQKKCEIIRAKNAWRAGQRKKVIKSNVFQVEYYTYLENHDANCRRRDVEFKERWPEVFRSQVKWDACVDSIHPEDDGYIDIIGFTKCGVLLYARYPQSRRGDIANIRKFDSRKFIGQIKDWGWMPNSFLRKHKISGDFANVKGGFLYIRIAATGVASADTHYVRLSDIGAFAQNALFIVDTSYSMATSGAWKIAGDEIKRSISRFSKKQCFRLIAMDGCRRYPTECTRQDHGSRVAWWVPATKDNRADAIKKLRSASGGFDIVKLLKRAAMRPRKETAVFLITDGDIGPKSIDAKDQSAAAEYIADLGGKIGSPVNVLIIGNNQPCPVLEKLAKQTGGKLKRVAWKSD